MPETYLYLPEMDYFETGEAFKGLADENVWKRTAATLLSVGEIAGHICYWEASRLTGSIVDFGQHAASDPDSCCVKSPLIDSLFGYYPKTLSTPPCGEFMARTANDVLLELQRVHSESVAVYRQVNADLDTAEFPSRESTTKWEILKYPVFHVAYHMGQIYQTRHLPGETTVDN